MPMPRFTSIPFLSSRAIRRAIIVAASMASSIRDQVVNQRCRGQHMIRCNEPDWNDMVGRSDGALGGHGDDWIEVSRSQDIGQIAEIIGEKGIYQREVGPQCRLDQVVLAIQFDLPLALLNDCANPGWCQHATEAKSTG